MGKKFHELLLKLRRRIGLWRALFVECPPTEMQCQRLDGGGVKLRGFRVSGLRGQGDWPVPVLSKCESHWQGLFVFYRSSGSGSREIWPSEQ